MTAAVLEAVDLDRLVSDAESAYWTLVSETAQGKPIDRDKARQILFDAERSITKFREDVQFVSTRISAANGIETGRRMMERYNSGEWKKEQEECGRSLVRLQQEHRDKVREIEQSGKDRETIRVEVNRLHLEYKPRIGELSAEHHQIYQRASSGYWKGHELWVDGLRTLEKTCDPSITRRIHELEVMISQWKTTIRVDLDFIAGEIDTEAGPVSPREITPRKNAAYYRRKIAEWKSDLESGRRETAWETGRHLRDEIQYAEEHIRKFEIREDRVREQKAELARLEAERDQLQASQYDWRNFKLD